MANVSGNTTLNNISLTGLDDLVVDNITATNATFYSITTHALNTTFQANIDLEFVNTLQVNNNLVFGALADGIDIPAIDNVSTPAGNTTLAVRGKTYLGDTAYTNGISNTGDITSTGAITGNELVQTGTSSALTIANYAFDTPVRPINNGVNYISTPSTITGWTFTNISGTAPSVLAVGRGFWDTLGPNTFVNYYPDYPVVNQALAIRQTTTGNYQLSQSISATTGYYLVSGWIWGKYNDYKATQTATITFGTTNSGAISASEQAWKKIQYITQITTSGANTLAINVIQTAAATNSTIVMTDFRITKIGGISARKTGSVSATNAIIAETNIGIHATGIYNQGAIYNYGPFYIYGQLSPGLNTIPNSMVIGDCKFGSAGQTLDGGSNTILIGHGIGANIAQPAGTNATLTNIIAIGAGALEQAQLAMTDTIAIGRWACRYAGGPVGIFIGTQAGSQLGYSGRTNMTNNLVIGHYAMAQIFTQNNQFNSVVGNYALGASDATNSRAYNTIVGYGTGYNIMSNYHTAVGHSCLYNNNAVGSVGNVALGAFAGNNSSGANTLKYTTFLGYGADLNTNIVCENSTSVGAFAKIQESDTIEMGGPNQTTGAYPAVVIPNKVKLQTSVLVGSVASYTISFRTPENIIVNTSTTTTINLPVPAQLSVGASFYIFRAYTTGVVLADITIQATAGINIVSNESAANTYIFGGLETLIKITLIATTGNAWSVCGKTINPYLANSIVATQESTNAERYVDFSDQSATSTTYIQVKTDTELRYNPSLNRLSVPNIRMPDKQEIQKSVSAGAVATYNLSFPLPQTLIIDSATTTEIYLPSASTANIGASVIITRQYLVSSNLTTIAINTSVAETIQSWDVASTIVLYMDPTITTMICTLTSATKWTASYSRENVQLNQAPMTITTATTGALTITLSAPFYKVYPYTNVATSLTINLPVLTASMVGWEFTFKRMGGVYNATIFNPSSVIPTAIFQLGTAYGDTGAVVLINGVQNVLSMVVVEAQKSFTGTFSNTAGATQITIDTLPGTGAAVMSGGYFSFNGNLRYITSDAGGRGGTGLYNIDTAIAAANTTQAYTAYVSYAWAILFRG